MRNAIRAGFLAALIVTGSAGAAGQTPRKTLQAFANEQEIAGLFARWNEEHQRKLAQERGRRDAEPRAHADSAPPPMAAPSMAAKAAPASTAGAAADSVTNVQHAGVDEGGIVKLHGDHLV